MGMDFLVAFATQSIANELNEKAALVVVEVAEDVLKPSCLLVPVGTVAGARFLQLA
jgi:hypothetical protein